MLHGFILSRGALVLAQNPVQVYNPLSRQLRLVFPCLQAIHAMAFRAGSLGHGAADFDHMRRGEQSGPFLFLDGFGRDCGLGPGGCRSHQERNHSRQEKYGFIHW